MKKLADFLIFGSLFIAACAVAMAIETNLLLKLPLHHPFFYCFIFGATLVQYNLHYLNKRPRVPLSERDAWSLSHRKTIKWLVFAGILLTLLGIRTLTGREFGVLAVMAMFALLYSLPFLPFQRRRLKEFGLLKIFLLSLEWTLVTVWLPAEESGIDPTGYWLVFLRRFLFIFVLCLLFDIRDRDSDQADNIRTIPVRMGIQNTYHLADAGLLLFLLLSVWQLLHAGNFPFFHAMLLSAICTKWVMQWTKKYSHDYTYLAGVDGMMLLQALLVVIGTF